jgi:hypothetical protein
MSLKRLLNPSSDDLGRYHQPQLGWDHYGAPIEYVYNVCVDYDAHTV